MDKKIEVWKIQKLIKTLETAKGNGKCMISLIIPPNDQILRATNILGNEFDAALKINDEVNRQPVLDAIGSALDKVKLYSNVPSNGLVIYTGTILNKDNYEESFTFDFEPFKPMKDFHCICDYNFHTEGLNELLKYDEKFGFIVSDEYNILFGILEGNEREVLYKFSVDFRGMHGRRTYSLEFARRQWEKRCNSLRKTAELAALYFINPATDQPNVAGIILAGWHFLGEDSRVSNLFDSRLQSRILGNEYVRYGGETGFRMAIEASSDILQNAKLLLEKKLIEHYFEEVRKDKGKYVFGVEETLEALELGAVETLIVWEDFDINLFMLKTTATKETMAKSMNKEQEANEINFGISGKSAEMEMKEKMALVEWFAIKCKKFDCNLELVTNKSEEGLQFCRDFGGVGGILRYGLEMKMFDEQHSGDFHDYSE